MFQHRHSLTHEIIHINGAPWDTCRHTLCNVQSWQTYLSPQTSSISWWWKHSKSSLFLFPEAHCTFAMTCSASTVWQNTGISYSHLLCVDELFFHVACQTPYLWCSEVKATLISFIKWFPEPSSHPCCWSVVPSKVWKGAWPLCSWE